MPNEGWMTTLVHIRNIWAAKETSSQMVLEGPTVMLVRFSAEAIHLSWGPNNVVMSKANGALAKLSPGPAVTRSSALVTKGMTTRHVIITAASCAIFPLCDHDGAGLFSDDSLICITFDAFAPGVRRSVCLGASPAEWPARMHSPPSQAPRWSSAAAIGTSSVPPISHRERAGPLAAKFRSARTETPLSAQTRCCFGARPRISRRIQSLP
ncbi:hypothetical protein HPB51_010390 [Rhipicephalus microplus]|uniref:Uncharacterized protein n=1 Tax=Rhipicephalus microplus TaxID=6941 RepID=A0A9J6D901_RHIMP|nr:hypothetical protein HPB51_010390 [Rhipicephalus microplus]